MKLHSAHEVLAEWPKFPAGLQIEIKMSDFSRSIFSVRTQLRCEKNDGCLYSLKKNITMAIISEKHKIVRKRVDHIDVDHAKKYRCFVRKIQAGPIELEEIFKRNRQSSAVVSRTSSGGESSSELILVVEAPFRDFR